MTALLIAMLLLAGCATPEPRDDFGVNHKKCMDAYKRSHECNYDMEDDRRASCYEKQEDAALTKCTVYELGDP